MEDREVRNRGEERRREGIVIVPCCREAVSGICGIEI
jgi:hypothetical protein